MEDDQVWNQLDCHFVWDLEASIVKKGHAALIKYLLKDMKMNLDVETKAIVTLCYMYSLNNDEVEAEQMVERAILTCEKKLGNFPNNQGYRAVALANKAYILWTLRKPEDQIIAALNVAAEAAAEAKKSPLACAGIDGMKGYTYSLFDDYYADGVSAYQRAMRNDPRNFEWPLGICILSRRLRQLVEGFRSLPTIIEEDAARRSVKLSEGKKALPVAVLADVLLAQGMGPAKGQDVPSMKAEAGRLYRQAYELEPTCSYVLKRCGKAFSVLQDFDFAEKCLLEALEIDEGNATVLHRLGQLYEYSGPKQDYERSEKYYQLAAVGSSSHRRNVFADIDLARIRAKRFRGYNILDHYLSIRKYYIENSRDLDFVDRAIERQREYLASAKTRRPQVGRGQHKRAPYN